MQLDTPIWRRRSRIADALAFLSYWFLIAWLAFVVLAVLFFGEVSASATPNTYLFSLATMGLVALSFSALFVVLSLDRRRATALINKTFSENQLPPGEPVILYLRSFATSMSYKYRNFFRELEDPEWDISASVSDRATFLAIGDRHDAVQALKIKTSDEKWKEIFESLAERAVLIICFVGGTPSSLFEIQAILKDDGYFRKTLFLSPPSAFPEYLEGMRTLLAEHGADVPPFSAAGQFFRPSRHTNSMLCIDYQEALRLLRTLDLRSADVANEIWASYDQRRFEG